MPPPVTVVGVKIWNSGNLKSWWQQGHETLQVSRNPVFRGDTGSGKPSTDPPRSALRPGCPLGGVWERRVGHGRPLSGPVGTRLGTVPACPWLPYSSAPPRRQHAQGSAFEFSRNAIFAKRIDVDRGDTANHRFMSGMRP